MLNFFEKEKRILAMTTFERIKKLAKQHGMTLAKLNEKAGLGTNSIYHWKTKKPSTDNLQKVAKVLNVSVDYLLGKDEHKIAEKRTADLTDDDVIFTYQGKPLSEEDKELIKRLMNGKD